jgi:hypothetical protein
MASKTYMVEGLFFMQLALPKLKCPKLGTGGPMVKGWLRDKDENTTCPEGYRKKQRTHQENQEGLEVTEGFARADLLSNQRL